MSSNSPVSTKSKISMIDLVALLHGKVLDTQTRRKRVITYHGISETSGGSKLARDDAILTAVTVKQRMIKEYADQQHYSSS